MLTRGRNLRRADGDDGAHPAGRPRPPGDLPSGWFQRGCEPGARGRSRRTRSPSRARRPPLGGRHELHARHRRDQGAPRDARDHPRSALGRAPVAKRLRDTAPELTPMMRQYRELKTRYPDYLLLFRLGDFYEVFFDDAHVASRLLQITLTSRQKGEGAIPMAGIPHHAADGYVARLIRAGQKVAVCEQMEAPAKGRKLVRREVVRVITPGTITDTQFLDGAANNFLLAVHRAPSVLGVALVDISTGEFWVGEAGEGETGKGEAGKGKAGNDAAEALLETALLRRPAEILLSRNAEAEWVRRIAAIGLPVTSGDPGWFAPRTARETLAAQFRSATLDGFGVAAMTAGLQAAGGALAYLRDTQGESLTHLTRIQRFVAGDAMLLDPTAVVTLELLATAQERSSRGSLVATLDRTKTPMGARLLRQWLLRPLLDLGAIARRQEAVGALVEDPAVRATLSRRLKGVGDLERLTSRAALGVAHARDLVALRGFLNQLPTLREELGALGAPLCRAIAEDVVAP